MASFFPWLAKAASSAYSNSFGGKRKLNFGHGMSFGALAAGVCCFFFYSSPDSIEHNKDEVDSDSSIGSGSGERKSPDFSVGSEDYELRMDDFVENLTSTEDIEQTIQLSSHTHTGDHGSMEAEESETDQVLARRLANNSPKKMEEPNKPTFEVFDEQPVDPLAKSWMNLRFDVVGVGLELADLIFDGLLEEVISAFH